MPVLLARYLPTAAARKSFLGVLREDRYEEATAPTGFNTRGRPRLAAAFDSTVGKGH